VKVVRFSTEDGVSLEGELRMPEGGPRGSAVVCHAHPRHGGSKDHPVLWAIRNELAHRGFGVLAFNFRGTMRSGGTFAGGRGETRDVAAAIGRVRDEVGPRPTIVCGWSFGANVALREALDDERVAALALIGLPLGAHELDLPELPTASELRAFDRPVLVLAGESDEYCPPAEVRSFLERLASAEAVILPGTDHFLWRREREAASRIGEFVERAVDPSG
jgi:alpha/beta superfamily hydrolase